MAKMKKYQIVNARVEQASGGPDADILVAEIELKPENGAPFFYTLVECGGMPMVYKTETSVFDWWLEPDAHEDELDEESATVFAQLKFSGWTLLNQSVMLKGVNDDAETLERLSRKLFEQGVLPYYLHQLDHAKGVAHFEISDERAKELIAQIRTKLPGYLVPKLVREIAGEKSKTPI